jgi:hypothetical protein
MINNQLHWAWATYLPPLFYNPSSGHTLVLPQWTHNYSHLIVCNKKYRI